MKVVPGLPTAFKVSWSMRPGHDREITKMERRRWSTLRRLLPKGGLSWRKPKDPNGRSPDQSFSRMIHGPNERPDGSNRRWTGRQPCQSEEASIVQHI